MRILRGLAVAPLLFALASASATAAPQRARKPMAHKNTPPPPPPLACGDYLSFQVLLDRQGFSPGQIDGRPGTNLSHALTALQQARKVAVTGQPDCDTWKALGGDQAAGDVTVQVARADSSLRVLDAGGKVIFFAPVTTGSEHDPLPPGNWTVTGVDWHPAFHYNPDLFWDAKPGDNRATIKAGPNNPVGVVWINLSLEHYGLHGTPEPANIGRTESHGCVRLTNWDAVKVASLVKKGTPVIFQ